MKRVVRCVTMSCAVPVLMLRRAKLFGDEAKARQWARSPQPELGGLIPDELVPTLDGLERALSQLESLAAYKASR